MGLSKSPAKNCEETRGLVSLDVVDLVAAIGRFDEVPLEGHDQVIKTDLLGTSYGSHLALKHFRERGAGILINVASAIGKIPPPSTPRMGRPGSASSGWSPLPSRYRVAH